MVPVTPAALRANRIAERAHGIVTYLELLEAGLARQTIALWARSGRLHRVHEGVYSVVPLSMLTIEGRWMAAVKAGGPGAALSNESAGELAWILPRKKHPQIHIVVPDRSRRRIPGLRIHRPRHIEPRDFTTRREIRTTTLERTIWDLAYNSRADVVRDAFELADGHDRLDLGRLATLVEAHPNRRGSKLVARLVAEGSVPLAQVRSWLEELFARICGRHRLPLPESSAALLDYEVDFLWESARFVVEADGGNHLKRSQRDKDNARDIALQRAGYMVRRYSSRDMEREDAVAAEVIAILRERLALPRQG